MIDKIGIGALFVLVVAIEVTVANFIARANVNVVFDDQFGRTTWAMSYMSSESRRSIWFHTSS
ncbi:hypothetical protein BCT03_07435 [Vibrio splendidus]|nr:hypothetical protein A147_09380 [Vibrio splendidus FF-6]PMO68152.1 hypothetical protein BCT03_07435 [Vibrio splendidus]